MKDIDNEGLEDLASYIRQKENNNVQEHIISHGELTMNVAPEDIISFLRFLQQDTQCEFICLIDIAGADYPSRSKRFDVIYHLLSPRQNRRIRVKVQTDEKTPVPSAAEIYSGAVWFEREAYDLYGILFSDNPDLRRILTDYGFEGHPLRKDFPLTGFLEVRYDDQARKVVYDPIELRQEFRNFDFVSPWKGMDEIFFPDKEGADLLNPKKDRDE